MYRVAKLWFCTKQLLFAIPVWHFFLHFLRHEVYLAHSYSIMGTNGKLKNQFVNVSRRSRLFTAYNKNTAQKTWYRYSNLGNRCWNSKHPPNSLTFKYQHFTVLCECCTTSWILNDKPRTGANHSVLDIKTACSLRIFLWTVPSGRLCYAVFISFRYSAPVLLIAYVNINE